MISFSKSIDIHVQSLLFSKIASDQYLYEVVNQILSLGNLKGLGSDFHSKFQEFQLKQYKGLYTVYIHAHRDTDETPHHHLLWGKEKKKNRWW